MASGLGWFPWRRVDIQSPLAMEDAREALLGNVPSVFRGRVSGAGFRLTRKSLVINGKFAGVERVRVRVTLRLPWRAYGMLMFGLLAFPALLGRGMLREPSAGWAVLSLAGLAFVLSGISPVWRFHRAARWSEHALRAIFGAL
jgi:hypothetical protein